MNTLIYILFSIGAICFFSAYGFNSMLWDNAFYHLTSLGNVFYLLSISVLAFSRKMYVIEMLALIFSFCQLLQYFDELTRSRISLNYLEILLPLSVTVLLVIKHINRK